MSNPLEDGAGLASTPLEDGAGLDSAAILDELTWRGLIAQSTDQEALRAAVATPLSLYIGFDPTARSLHAGHLVQILTLRRFQQYGHRPVLLAGGATGQIGDPRDVGERVMQDTATVTANAERIRGQMARFVEFGDDLPNGAIEVNNLQWTGNLGAIEFLRDIGKHFPVNVMLGRDTVKRRLATDGISYTEFSYMLLQANDFVTLAQQHGVSLQVGGSDQWGNIVAGVDFGRRARGLSLHAITTPLVTDSDGAKIGKSTGGGSLWLDAELTSPYAFYQYFVNAGDTVVGDYLRWFTFLSQEEIAELDAATAHTPHLRLAQKRLAAEITTLVHGPQATAGAELASQALFGRAELTDLDAPTLRGALAETTLAEFAAPPTVVDLLVQTGLATGNKAARRTVAEGGVYVNNVKISDEEWVPAPADLLYGEFLVIRRGKKSFAGARVVPS